MSPRQKSDKSKRLRFEIRMTEETAEKLDFCAEKLNCTKTDVIQRGIDLVKSEIEEEK